MKHEPSKVKDIFNRIIELEPEVDRSNYLDEACAGDAELRGKVQALLNAYGEAGSFLESTPPGLRPAPGGIDATLDQPPREGPGTVIGPYKLLQQIGEGGMGVVYMAEQTQPVERRVALKIIKPGMDSRQVIARFESERQALAMMDHPHIAKVLDAGSTDYGRPYFVMELVRGIPITKFCDDKHLGLRERLELFVPVCQAIQHAHQKGIIHRDVKPSNVLVALYDSRPVPKVIDFGVAKATVHKLTQKTMFTEFGQLVGTLEYMSPEQAELNQLDIDTRSDIYSLGVLLYELLTGSTPLDRQRLRTVAFDEMLRIIREEEPPKPSTRISTSGTSPSVAANRNSEPGRWSKLVRGELDWIVMKSLEKERSRRYETANGLAMDIQRYLQDEQVEACPPSASYRFRKFARRNKALLATVTLVTASLVAGLMGTAWQYGQATRAEAKALAERDEKANAWRVATENAKQATEAAEKEQAARMAEQSARLIAQEQSQLAQQQQRDAEKSRDAAAAYALQLKSVTEEQRRTIYTAEMNLVRLEAQRSNLAGIRNLLMRQFPEADQDDLRGFEWNYWYRFLNRAETLHRFDSGDSDFVAVVPGGELVARGKNGQTELVEVATGKVSRTLPVPLQSGPNRNSFSANGRLGLNFNLWDIDGKAKPLEKFDDARARYRFWQISRDGRIVASLQPEGVTSRLLLWNSDTGEFMHNILISEPRELSRLAFSPDATRIAAYDGHSSMSRLNEQRGVVAVFDVASGEKIAVARHDDNVDTAFFLPDNQTMLLCSMGFSGRGRKELYRWNVGYNPPLRLGTEYMPDHLRGEVSPDGTLFAVGGHTVQTIRLIDTKNGALVDTLRHEASYFRSLTFTPDGKRIVATTNSGIVLQRNLNSNNDLFRWKANPMAAVSPQHTLSPDQSWLAATNGGELHIRHRDGSEKLLTSGHADNNFFISKLMFSWDSELLMVVRRERQSQSSRIELFDTNSGEELWSKSPTLEPRTISYYAFSSDGKYLVAAQEKRIFVWEARTGETVRQDSLLDSRPFVSASPLVASSQTNSTRLLLAALFASEKEPAQLCLFDAITGEKLEEVSIPSVGTGTQVIPAPNERHVGLLRRANQQVEIWDLAEKRQTLSTPGDSIVFHSDGLPIACVELRNRQALGNFSVAAIEQATLWNIESGTSHSTIDWKSNPPEKLRFSPDGRRLLSLHGQTPASGGAVPEGRLWDVSSGAELLTIPVADVNHFTWDLEFDAKGTSILSFVLAKSVFGSKIPAWGATIYDAFPLSVTDDALLVARPLVGELLARSPLSVEALAAIKANERLRPSVRKAAIDLVRNRADELKHVAEACLRIVALPTENADDYTKSLRWAQAYREMSPNDPLSDVLVGAALLRCGELTESLAILGKPSSETPIDRPSQDLPVHILRLAFLTLANCGAGNLQAAESEYVKLLKETIQSKDYVIQGYDVPVSSGDPHVVNYVLDIVRQSSTAILDTGVTSLERLGLKLAAMLDQDGDGTLSKEELSVVANRLEVSGVNGATFKEFSQKYARRVRGSLFEEDALQSLASAIQLDPQLADLYVQRGEIWVSRKEWDKAIAEFDSAIRFDSNVAQAYLARGNARKAQGLFVAALQDFSDAIRLDPTSRLAYFERAYTRSKLKDYPGAIKDYDEAIRLNDRHALSYNNRGFLKHCLKDYAAAIADYETAVRLDASQVYAKVNMAFLLATAEDASIRNPDEALKLAEGALSEDVRQNAYAMNAKSCALAAQGDYEAAIKLQKSLSDRSWLEDENIDGGSDAKARVAAWESGELWHP